MTGARRRGGATLATATDLFRWSWRTRNWMLLVVVLTIGISVLIGGAVQFVAPWTIYAGL